MSPATLTRKFEVRLERAKHEQLRELASQRGISLAALIREAVSEKLATSRSSR